MKLNKSVVTPVLLLIAVSFFPAAKSIAQPNLIFVQQTSALTSPMDIVNAGDGSNRLFIVERAGRVRIFSGGVLLPNYFLDIPDSTTTDGERGLLSIAFHPNFVNNRYFFIFYTTSNGSLRLTRFRTQAGDPDAADENTGTVLLTIPHPGQSNHNGGKLNFGPDGYLYLSTGDGGGTGDPNNNSQNGNSLLGKMIRINVDDFNTPPYYAIPSSNPYVNDPNVRDEVFAMGLRNPFRWSFDRANNDIWIGDVGQGLWEEVNRRTYAAAATGTNYGWRCYEGLDDYNTSGCQPLSSYTSPIYAYGHNASGGYCITGGYVYRAAQYGAMYGYYFCADYVSGRVFKIKQNGSNWDVFTQSSGANVPGSIVGFGEDELGNLYAVTLPGGLYKVTTNTAGPVPMTLLQFSAKAFTGYNELKWKTVNEQDLKYYDVEYSSDGTNFLSAGKINANNNVLENNYTLQHFITAFTRLYYRIKTNNKDGSVVYSNILSLDNKDKTGIRIYPTLLKEDHINIISARPVEQISFFSAEGKIIFQRKLNGFSGTGIVPLPQLQKGFYIVQLKLDDGYFNQKILIQR